MGWKPAGSLLRGGGHHDLTFCFTVLRHRGSQLLRIPQILKWLWLALILEDFKYFFRSSQSFLLYFFRPLVEFLLPKLLSLLTWEAVHFSSYRAQDQMSLWPAVLVVDNDFSTEEAGLLFGVQNLQQFL